MYFLLRRDFTYLCGVCWNYSCYTRKMGVLVPDPGKNNTDGAVLAFGERYNILKTARTGSCKGVSGRALYGENRTGLPVRKLLYQ